VLTIGYSIKIAEGHAAVTPQSQSEVWPNDYIWRGYLAVPYHLPAKGAANVMLSHYIHSSHNLLTLTLPNLIMTTGHP
jgi:hypothetical protein